MTHRIANEILEGFFSTYSYPVPYWCMGEGDWELVAIVGGSP